MPCTRIRAEIRWGMRGCRMSRRARAGRVAGSGRPRKVALNATASWRRSVTVAATARGNLLRRYQRDFPDLLSLAAVL